MFDYLQAIAGLGFFLSGLSILSDASREQASKKLISSIDFISKNYYGQALFGMIIGSITQSTSASTFICMGLVNAGVLRFERALTMVAWASVGGSVLVFLTAVDVGLLGLYLLATFAIARLLSLQDSDKIKGFLTIFFALGLVFVGLGMVKHSAHVLEESYWVKEFVEFAAEISPISFILGLFFTIIVQSASIITVVAITFVFVGVIPYDAAMLIMFGANVGSGVSLLLLTANLEGVQKQIVLYQLFARLCGVLIVMPCFFIYQVYAPIYPDISSNPEMIALSISLMYLILQIVGAASVSIWQPRVIQCLEKLSPKSEEATLSQPQFIYSESLSDPYIAMQLIRREQDRVIFALTLYLSPFRKMKEMAIPISALHTANNKLLESIEEFIEMVTYCKLGEGIAQLIDTQSRQEAITSITKSLYAFSNGFEVDNSNQTSIQTSMVESLHMLFSLLKDECEDSSMIPLLVELTSEKSSIMDAIRDSLVSDSALSVKVKKDLFMSTRHFEKIIWRISQIVALDKNQQRIS